MSTSGFRVFALAWALSLSLIVPAAWAQQPVTESKLDATGIESLKKTALQEAEAGETDAAIRDYERILGAQPEWHEGQWNLGMLEYQGSRYAQSRETFQKVVAFAPQMGVAWAVLGLSEFEIKNFDDSLTHLEKARALGMKDDAEIERVSLYHLALLLIRGGEFERATEVLQASFGGDLMSAQIKSALGLATLRVPLLPEQIDPSQEALIAAVGAVVSQGSAAISAFPALLRTYPDVPYLHLAYGLDLAAAGRDAEALEMLRAETTISPASALPWAAMSRILLGSGKAEAAHAAAQKAADLERAGGERTGPEQRMIVRYGGVKPGEAASTQPSPELCDRAMRAYGSGQYASAVPDLKACLQANAANGTGWAVLGLSEFALRDYDNALIHLGRGAQLGLSGSADSLRLARYTFGLLLIRAGEFDRGSDVLLLASQSPPSEQVSKDQVEYALGLALLRRPELPEESNAQQIAVITAVGKIRLMLKDSRYDEAFVEFKALLKQNPKFPFLHYAYGTALLAISEFDDAAAQMKLETVVSPGSELPYVRLASIALRQHDAAQAAIAARRAVQLAPTSAEAHYLLGRALLESGDEAAALPELTAAGKISPGSPEVHFNLAKAYARAKMPAEAERERTIFSQLNEAAELQRHQQGNGTYEGPHDAGGISTSGQGSVLAPDIPK